MSQDNAAPDGLHQSGNRPRQTVDGLTKTVPDRFLDKLTDSGPAPRESQLRVLAAVWDSKPQPATRSWLSDEIDVAPSTIGRAVRGLEEDGLVVERELRGGSQVRPVTLVDPRYDAERELTDRSSMWPAIITTSYIDLLQNDRARESLEESGIRFLELFFVLWIATELLTMLTGTDASYTGNIFGAGVLLLVSVVLGIKIVGKVES